MLCLEHTNQEDIMNPSQAFLALLEAKLPDLVPRTLIPQVTGGLISAKTMANADSNGVGPSGRIKFGRRVAYPKDALIIWLRSKLT